MTYRTILVPVGRRENAESAIEAAFHVARRFCSHVHGLHVLPDLARPATHALIATRMTTEEASSDFQKFRAPAEREVKRQAAELKRLFHDAAVRAGAATRSAPGIADRPSSSWEEVTGFESEVVGGFESEVVGGFGRVFDLTVIARPGPRGSSHDTVQAALFETGRPLLLVPPIVPAAVGDVVLLAWNASPQAARAVTSALPFLRQAGRVTIMSVGTGPPPKPDADDLARALAWHGITAEARAIEQGPRRVRDVLLVEAEAMRADLLVIGAYSHSRMRQVVFGGVTEHVLDHAELPLFLAH